MNSRGTGQSVEIAACRLHGVVLLLLCFGLLVVFFPFKLFLSNISVCLCVCPPLTLTY